MQVKMAGSPMNLVGSVPAVGGAAPSFTVVAGDLSAVTQSDLKGTRVFITVPSIDTPVCDTEVRRFNKEAAALGNISINVISMDLPFAQAVDLCHFQQLRIGHADAGGNAVPDHRQDHQNTDENRYKIPLQPDQHQNGKGCYGGGLHRRHHRGDEAVRQGHRAGQHRQNDAEAHGDHRTHQDPPDGKQGDLPKLGGQRQFSQPPQHHDGCGQQEKIIHAQGQNMPCCHPKKDGRQDFYR